MSLPSLAKEKYVRLTTYTKDGRPKHTPVWIADLDGERLCFTTGLDSWKAKRIRNTPKVELVPSDMRGNVSDGAEPVSGTAVVVTDDADVAPVAAAIKAKYGWQVTMIKVSGKIAGLFRRNRGVANCGVVVTLD